MKQKVVFIVTTSGEVKLAQSLCSEIIGRGSSDVLVIDTGVLCCDKDGEPPTEALDKSHMSHTSLQGYKTKNMAKVLKREKADVLVVGSDQEYIRRALVYAAIGLHIPVLLLDVGIGSNKTDTLMATKRTVYRLNHYFTNIARKYLYVLGTVLALRWNPFRIMKMIINDVREAFTVYDNRGKYGCQRIAIAGSWEKQVLIERGVAPDKLVVTGNPTIWFSLRIGDDDKISSLRRDLGIGVNDKVILLLTSALVEHGLWDESMRDEFTNGVVDAVAPLLSKSVRLVVKIHPVEYLDYYQRLLENRKEKVSLCKNVVLADAINMSDVVLVCGYSTTVLEASALGKPVVLLNIFNEVEDIPYVEMGLAVGVHNLGELEPLVRELLYNHTSRAKCLHQAKLFFDSNREFVDGKATKRIVDLIAGMV